MAAEATWHTQPNRPPVPIHTLRIPDDDSDYPLPPGLGRFPLRHVDDHANDVSPEWIERGGVMFPMYQSEAMWLNFGSAGRFPYPVAVKIATGKINAVSGETWEDGLNTDPQDYVVIPKQPWLDGYCVEKGLIRQFVAMPLGAGYTAEEQITGAAEFGGLQIIAYPMKREAYLERRRKWEETARAQVRPQMDLACASILGAEESLDGAGDSMGLAPGGRMRQTIYDDPYRGEEWDTESSRRCFIHLANSLVWRSITGASPPTTPPTSREYAQAGLPWFEHYGEGKALEGSGVLKGLKSVLQMGKEKGDVPLPENQSVDPTHVVHLREGLARDQVREGTF